MTDSIPPAAVPGCFYAVSNDGGSIVPRLVTGPLPELDIIDGELVGTDVRVGVRAVLVSESGGTLVGRPVDPIRPRGGGLLFDPAGGGIRTRENRLARGAHNDVVAEAARFGMVNAFVHATKAACYSNDLLAELGTAGLPLLPLIVSAHSGSRLPGFAHDDGDYRSGRRRPLTGAHYRLSQRTSLVPEPLPVCPTGEVHLGPGRVRQRFAGQDGYLRAAAHNPATVYHEYAHHLCRHTADFRLNAERRPERQRNGKPGVEEGACDYFTASLMGSGRPYGWYRAERGARRDPETWAGGADLDGSDAHAVGAQWASLWWRCRQGLLEAALMPPRSHDRAVVATLLALGEVSAGGRGGESRRSRQLQRTSGHAVLGAYLEALREEGGRGAVTLGTEVARTAGLLDSLHSRSRAC